MANSDKGFASDKMSEQRKQQARKKGGENSHGTQSTNRGKNR